MVHIDDFRIRCDEMNFNHTLIRANLICGAEATLEVLRETSSALDLSRRLRSGPSSCFLSSKALTLFCGADIRKKSVKNINDYKFNRHKYKLCIL